MLTKNDILNCNNNEDAINLLILAGPDQFDGTYKEYLELLHRLESK